MLDPQSVTEQLLFNTIRIEAEDGTGGIASGTGFFFDHRLGGDRTLPLIVTNTR